MLTPLLFEPIAELGKTLRVEQWSLKSFALVSGAAQVSPSLSLCTLRAFARPSAAFAGRSGFNRLWSQVCAVLIPKIRSLALRRMPQPEGRLIRRARAPTDRSLVPLGHQQLGASLGHAFSKP
jgi:hypothetical protein